MACFVKLDSNYCKFVWLGLAKWNKETIIGHRFVTFMIFLKIFRKKYYTEYAFWKRNIISIRPHALSNGLC
jgi:hypothetical protein